MNAAQERYDMLGLKGIKLGLSNFVYKGPASKYLVLWFIQCLSTTQLCHGMKVARDKLKWMDMAIFQ